MTDNPAGKADLLAQLAAIRDRRRALDAEELKLVAELRQPTSRGYVATWDEIATAMGRLRQNVHKQYKPLLEETRTVRAKTHPDA